MITATSSPAFQLVQSARLDSQAGNNQGPELERFNIQSKEMFKSFSFQPQVRPSGFADQGSPLTPKPAAGRGGAVDFSV